MERRGIFVVLGLILLALTAGHLLSGCNSSTANAANDPPAAGAQLSDYFKSTDWVAEHSSDANFVIVDTRPTAAYDAGHIPGAISIPRDKFYFPRNVIDPATGAYKLDSNQQPVKIAYDIPTPAELIDILTNNGINPDTTVVAYDNDTSSYGGRVPWVLKAYGHAKAYVVDGGIDKWKDADGRPLSTGAVIPTPSAKPYKIASYQNHRITKSDLAAVIDTANGNATKSGYVISDVRTPSEYTGFATTVASGSATSGTWSVSSTPFVYSTNQGARPGHIPYAKFSDYASAVFTDYINPASGKPVASSFQPGHNVQVLKSEADLRAHFKSLGITPDKTVYNYCEGGFRSGVYTLILLGLGYPNVYNYDGSWNEWSIQGAAYPVVTGDGRVSGP
ncbi:MAG: sulfurtransferase [Deltaproteobacteria bacterium]|nr:sulfurtransferase [Deltaproteobacteria bacterium]